MSKIKLRRMFLEKRFFDKASTGRPQSQLRGIIIGMAPDTELLYTIRELVRSVLPDPEHRKVAEKQIDLMSNLVYGKNNTLTPDNHVAVEQNNEPMRWARSTLLGRLSDEVYHSLWQLDQRMAVEMPRGKVFYFDTKTDRVVIEDGVIEVPGAPTDSTALNTDLPFDKNEEGVEASQKTTDDDTTRNEGIETEETAEESQDDDISSHDRTVVEASNKAQKSKSHILKVFAGVAALLLLSFAAWWLLHDEKETAVKLDDSNSHYKERKILSRPGFSTLMTDQSLKEDWKESYSMPPSGKIFSIISF